MAARPGPPSPRAPSPRAPRPRPPATRGTVDPERLSEFVASWRASQESTEPANRDRAAIAIRSIQRDRGLYGLRIVLVPSPAAGVLAATVSGIGHGQRPLPGLRPDTGERRRLARLLARRLRLGDRGGQVDLPFVARRVGFGRAAGAGAVLRSMVGGVLAETWDADWREALDALTAAALAHELRATGPPRPDLAGGPGALANLLPAVGQVVADTIEDRLDDAYELRFGLAVRAMHLGQFDIEAPLAALAAQVLGEPPSTPPVIHVGRLELARSAGPWWISRRLAIVSERPVAMSFDEDGRLHAGHGPAIVWGDGFGLWAWHGVGVPDFVVDEPERITVRNIDRAATAEVRGVLLERFGGIERYLAESGARLIHEDATGRLWHHGLRTGLTSGMTIATVEVRNATPEPDGTYRSHLLHVPSELPTARAAVAWTFGMGAADYAPAAET
jgi:hypothetical protein